MYGGGGEEDTCREGECMRFSVYNNSLQARASGEAAAVLDDESCDYTTIERE